MRRTPLNSPMNQTALSAAGYWRVRGTLRRMQIVAGCRPEPNKSNRSKVDFLGSELVLDKQNAGIQAALRYCSPPAKKSSV